MAGTLSKNPDLVWRDEPESRDEILAAMEEGRDTDESGWVVIVDSGEIHQLNLLAGDIWMLCDGTKDEAAIVAELVAVYEADPVLVLADVNEFVEECLSKGWLQKS